jgi:hypothetical protein
MKRIMKYDVIKSTVETVREVKDDYFFSRDMEEERNIFVEWNTTKKCQALRVLFPYDTYRFTLEVLLDPKRDGVMWVRGYDRKEIVISHKCKVNPLPNFIRSTMKRLDFL